MFTGLTRLVPGTATECTLTGSPEPSNKLSMVAGVVSQLWTNDSASLRAGTDCCLNWALTKGSIDQSLRSTPGNITLPSLQTCQRLVVTSLSDANIRTC